MIKFNRVMAATCISIGVLAADVFASAAQWVVAVETANSRITLDPATGKQETAKKAPIEGVVSPDGKRVAFIKTLGAGEKSTNELFIAQIDNNGRRTNERMLTSGAGNAMQPQWLPDNKQIVYVRGEGKFQQVYLTNADNEKWSEKRASAGGVRSYLPRVAPDGRIAYLAERGREGKATLFDLVIVNDGKHDPVVKNTSITEYAFSPDGKKIAFSTHGELIILDLAGGDRISRKYISIDNRLNSFHATGLAWHPDGEAIAATLHFSGGRAADSDGKIEPLFGERAVFVIPIKGEAKWFTVPAAPKKICWVSAAS